MFGYVTAQEGAGRWNLSVRTSTMYGLSLKQRRILLMADIKQTKNKTELIGYEKDFNY